ncbi:hypothetical protein L1887_42860 [Cichorium endivia]|nr:hypothetical protein L1887_42860 [Cichorium endivia]
MTRRSSAADLNIEEFKGEQLRLTGDTDLTVYTMLLKVSSIDGNMKLDALDIDTSQGSVNASGNALLRDNWPVDITLNSALNIDPLKGEKVKVKVGGALRDKLDVGVNLSGPVGHGPAPRKRSWRKPGCRSILRDQGRAAREHHAGCEGQRTAGQPRQADRRGAGRQNRADRAARLAAGDQLARRAEADGH